MTKSYYHRGGDMPLLGQTIAEHFGSLGLLGVDNYNKNKLL